MRTGRWDWRAVAVANVRAGAVFAIGAAITGWRLASSQGVEPTSSVEWQRWLSTLAAVAVFGAALATEGARGRAPFALWVYRIDLSDRWFEKAGEVFAEISR